MDTSGDLDLRIEMPCLRTPFAFIVDDSAPCINPLYYYRTQVDPSTPEYYSETRGIPNDLLVEFVQMVIENGVKGKFTVLPYPAGLGSVDTWLEGFSISEMREWVDIVRQKLLANFDITAEMLTHTLVLNLETNALIRSAEQEDWHLKQNFDTLVPYITRALEILRDARLSPNGVTSPGAFGHTIEGDYARAVLEAEKKVNGRKVAWYFLHTETNSKVVMPRLMYLDRWKGEAVVSMVSSNDDWIWETMTHEVRSTWRDGLISEYADKYITADGKGGRLIEVLNAGSYVAFHTHWNSLFSNGAKIGMRVMREVFRRISSQLGERIRWMKFSEIALYVAATKALDAKIEERSEEIVLILDTPFKCQNLTFSLKCEKEVNGVILRGSDDNPLEEKILGAGEGSTMLACNSWLQRDGRIFMCIDLTKGRTVRLNFSLTKSNRSKIV
jgi:hypothetical protein